MNFDEYPALFTASDQASIAAQKIYLLLFKAHLVMLILASATGNLASIVSADRFRAWAALTAVFLGLGLVLMWIVKANQYERVWFDCRAIAESVKTVTWRYMMQTPPFDSQDEAAVDKLFVANLKEIREARKGAERHLSGRSLPGSSEISEKMRAVRTLSLNDRKSLFINGRLRDQKGWYEGKAQLNRASSSWWFWGIALIQIGALIVAIIQVAFGSGQIKLVSILMTVAASFVAWNQVRRRDELAQSYSLAAQELNGLEAIAPHVSQKEDFDEFVEQTEEAISREHTLWCARRSVSL